METILDLLIEQLCFHGRGPYDLRITAGECVGLSGPSGSGKTLLLRAIADLDPNLGRVALGEVPRCEIPAPLWRRQIGFLPAEPAWWFDHARPHFAEIDIDQLELLGLTEGALDQPLAHLSTGERQRLALLRLLANQPQALLLDEPTASLDGNATLQVEQLIETYRQTHAAPVLWVSHNTGQLGRVAKRHLTLSTTALEVAA